MRTFEFSEGTSNKFWRIELSGNRTTVTYGKIGTAGQTQIKDHADASAAQKEHDKLVAEKLKKGYRETTTGSAAAPAPVTTSLYVPLSMPAPKARKASAPAPASAPAEPGSEAVVRTFEYSDATSHKFWNVQRDGTNLTITYGRIGSEGQTQMKSFPEVSSALKERDKLIAEKVKKGYRETTPTAKKEPTSLRESLEAALVENPDELANHMAYADYLSEQGDPLGDFVRVQLALEDPTKPADQRKMLQAQEKKLLNAHARTWLGELAKDLLDNDGDDYESVNVTSYTFRRGWLDSIKASNFTFAFTRILARAPQIRLLRELHLMNNNYDEPVEPGDDLPEDTDGAQLYPLIRSPNLTNVRRFILGWLDKPEAEVAGEDGGLDQCHTHGRGLAGVVKVMPRLEELYVLAHEVDHDQLFALKTLDNLRILLVYHSHSYPLARLAKNPSLGNLTHLLCYPHALEPDDENAYVREPAVKALVTSPELNSLTHLRLRLSDMGDKGVKTIITSGILKRLKVLDLRHGCVSDEGARTLAACPDLKNLERLDLTNNRLTETGIAALGATGIKVVAVNQWRPGSEGANFSAGDQEYLYAGDIE